MMITLMFVANMICVFFFSLVIVLETMGLIPPKGPTNDERFHFLVGTSVVIFLLCNAAALYQAMGR